MRPSIQDSPGKKRRFLQQIIRSQRGWRPIFTHSHPRRAFLFKLRRYRTLPRPAGGSLPKIGKRQPIPYTGWTSADGRLSLKCSWEDDQEDHARLLDRWQRCGELMKTLTISVADDVFQRASQKAAAAETSLPKVVQDLLAEWTHADRHGVSGTTESQRRADFLQFLDELAVRPLKPGPSVGLLNREELYRRGVPGY